MWRESTVEIGLGILGKVSKIGLNVGMYNYSVKCSVTYWCFRRFFWNNLFYLG